MMTALGAVAGPRTGEVPWTAGPVLLLHGFLASGGAWAPVRQELRGIVPTLAPDLAGYGSGRSVVATYSLATLVEHLVPLVESERPAHVVGHSMGGLVALALARRLPESFESVGLVGLPVFHGRGDGLAFLHRARPSTRLTLHDHARAHRACEAAHRLRRAWIPAAAWLTSRPPEMLATMYDHTLESHTAGLERIVFAGLADELAAGLTTPVFALHGARDRSAPFDRARDLARRHGWKLSVARKSGHQLIFERPVTTASWIRERVLGAGVANGQAAAS